MKKTQPSQQLEVLGFFKMFSIVNNPWFMDNFSKINYKAKVKRNTKSTPFPKIIEHLKNSNQSRGLEPDYK